MNRKFLKTGLLMGIVCLALSANASPEVKQLPKKQVNQVLKLDDAVYTVTYDSFINGALPLFFNRTFDDGPKRLLIRIQFEGNPSSTAYQYVYFTDGTDLQITFNQYSVPGFVEVTIDEIVSI